jgi:hypothetical protein
MSMFQQTLLAAETYLAEGLALKQFSKVMIKKKSREVPDGH